MSIADALESSSRNRSGCVCRCGSQVAKVTPSPSLVPILQVIVRACTQYTLGLQTGEDSRFLKAIVTLKHWDAYSLEDSDGFARYNFNAIVSPFALADTYWPAFEKAVKVGGAQGVLYS